MYDAFRDGSEKKSGHFIRQKYSLEERLKSFQLSDSLTKGLPSKRIRRRIPAYFGITPAFLSLISTLLTQRTTILWLVLSSNLSFVLLVGIPPNNKRMQTKEKWLS